MKLTINPNRCPQNHRCPAIRVCPQQAISQKHFFSLPVVDEEQCTTCGKCVRYCPMGAIELKKD